MIETEPTDTAWFAHLRRQLLARQAWRVWLDCRCDERKAAGLLGLALREFRGLLQSVAVEVKTCPVCGAKHPDGLPMKWRR